MLLGQTATQLSLIDDFWKILEAAAQKIHKKEKVDIFEDLKEEFSELSDLTFKELLKAIETGFNNAVIDNEPDLVMLENLKNNAYVFSAFKTYQELRQATDLLFEDKDKTVIKPFSKYLEDIRVLNKTYNEHYLRAEYNHAIASSQQASIWADIWQDRDLFDLQFDAINDERTRESHATLDGIVRPIEDDFWDIYYPPLGWNCRCTVRKIRKGDKKLSEVSKLTGSELRPMFRVNTTKQGVVFPEKHPYFEENKKQREEIKKASDLNFFKNNNIGLVHNFEPNKDKSLIDNIYKKAPNLNIPRLINQVNSITQKHGIKLKNQLVESFDDSSFQKFLSLSWTGESKGEHFTLTRCFGKSGNKITVKHDIFSLPKHLQGRGISKEINKILLKEYLKSNISQIDLYANKDIGGYTWAKYGFVSTDKTVIESIINKGFRDKKITQTQKDSLLLNIESDIKNLGCIVMNDIARQPYGKDLLLGTNWEGKLDLTDEKQLNHFIKYINK